MTMSFRCRGTKITYLVGIVFMSRSCSEECSLGPMVRLHPMTLLCFAKLLLAQEHSACSGGAQEQRCMFALRYNVAIILISMAIATAAASMMGTGGG